MTILFKVFIQEKIKLNFLALASKKYIIEIMVGSFYDTLCCAGES